jgi:hypothetical protein
MKTRRPAPPRRQKHGQYDYNVFINCPFDNKYKPLFYAMVFTIHHAGFIARCALEASTQNYRFPRILDIIGECRYGIHDVSRSVSGQEPRNNMPLELGVFIGCQYFGKPYDLEKEYLVLDTKAHEYKKYLTDLGGEDPSAHGDTVEGIINCVRDWLSVRIPVEEEPLPGADYVRTLYQIFLDRKEEFCDRYKLRFEKLTFPEYVKVMTAFLEEGHRDMDIVEGVYKQVIAQAEEAEPAA